MKTPRLRNCAVSNPVVPEADLCSECGILISEHPSTDECAIASETRGGVAPSFRQRTQALVDEYGARRIVAEQLRDRFLELANEEDRVVAEFDLKIHNLQDFLDLE